MFGFIRKLFGPSRARRAVADNLQLLAENYDVIMRVAVDGRSTFVSPSCFRLFGWTPEEMLGKKAEAFVHPDDMPAIAAGIARNIAKGGEGDKTSLRIRKSDGTWLWVEVSCRILRDPMTGDFADSVLTLRDISDRRAFEERLSALAMTDSLTGLGNRRTFDQTLETEWRKSRRAGTAISLLLLDLDRFKLFNDSYGHQVGDDCLRAVAAVIQMTLRRPRDHASRYGGEEIAVILPDTDPTGAREVGEMIRAALETMRIPHVGNPEWDRVVTASIGVATAVSPRAARLKGRTTCCKRPMWRCTRPRSGAGTAWKARWC